LHSDPLLHFPHVADQAHNTSAVAEPFQGIHNLFQGLFVQAAKAFVHKKCFDLDAAGLLLDNIRQSQCEGQGRHKGFAAGEGRRIPAVSGPLVHHFQAQARLCAASGLGIGVLEQVAAIAHRHQAFGSCQRYLFQPCREDVAVQAHAVGVVAAAGGGVSQ